MSNNATTQLNSPAWLFFVRSSFVVSVFATLVGVYFMPAALWVKGYVAMGILYIIGTTFMLSKTLRDEYETTKLISRIEEAKTDRILKNFDVDSSAL